VKAQMRQRFRDSNFYDLSISDIQFLQTIKDKAFEKFTIAIDAEALTDQIVEDIAEIVSQNPGPTKLCFSIRDAATNKSLTFQSQKHQITVVQKLVSYIESNEDMKYYVN